MKTSGFQAHPTFLKVFVGQGIYIYIDIYIFMFTCI